MRIIGGHLGGRKLFRPKNLKTRPTTDRVRESIYALIEARISLRNAELLDLFSGTGALALEGISRGAQRAILVDSDPKAIRASQQNAEHLNQMHSCRFLCVDAVKYLRHYRGVEWTLILADPPYELEALMELPDLALSCLSPEGLFVLEHDLRTDFSGHESLDTTRAYGRTHVSIFRL